MKQLLFLLLLPCFAMAQYTGNANQKITLGEQTTADGLVFRGVASIDTVAATSKITRANKQDTSAFLLLDTVTNLLWHYKTASNGWIQAGGGVSVSSFSAGTTGLTPSTATTGAVTLGGTLAVANGGTNRTTMPAGYILHGDGTSVDTTSQLFFNSSTLRFGVGTVNPASKLEIATDGNANNITATAYRNDAGQNSWNSRFARGTMATPLIVQNGDAIGSFGFEAHNGTNFNLQTALFYTKVNGTVTSSSIPTDYHFNTDAGGLAYLDANKRMTIASGGAITIHNLAGSGDRTVIASATGVLSAPVSSITTKENVQILNYGLNEILQINPISFDYIDKNKWGEERKLGFIVEDIFPIIPEVTGTMNNGDLYLDMVKLIPILTKAIQEQNALIKALEQRILILENK